MLCYTLIMPFVSNRPKIELNNEKIDFLTSISHSRTAPAREIERAKIILLSYNGKNDSQIAKELGINRQKVILCMKKALAFGVKQALDDLPRSGRSQEIKTEARAWIISLACMKPKDLGYPHELWTQQLLAEYVRENCLDQKYPELIKLSSGTVSKILAASNIKPHKISSYIHRHDPDFDSKSVVVLHTYKQVELLKEKEKNGEKCDVVIVSYDEKPGIQAIENKYPDLMPVKGLHPTISRDYEYVRHGTLSLLAGIDLLTGTIHYQMHERHRSSEFIEFLKSLDSFHT